MVQNKELTHLQGEVEKHKKCIGKHESYIKSIIVAYVEKHKDFDVERGIVYYTVAKAKKDGGFSAKHQRTYESDVLSKK